MKTLLLLGSALLASCASPAHSQAAHSQAPMPRTSAPAPVTVADTTTMQQRFDVWKADFIARMSERHDPATVRALLEPIELQDQLLVLDENQPEFTKPVWNYLQIALNDRRVANGQTNMELFTPTFLQVARRYRVDAAYLTAIWGMESAYGANMGENPVPDALATFAFEGRRSAMFTAQLEALVELVAQGRVRPDQLRGAWAGAMGMTQFMPITMRDYAVDMDGDGNIDLRGSEADALGSAAHYLSRMGWVAGQPAMVEVNLPDGFDYALGDGRTRRSARDWTAMGVRAVAGMPSNTVDADAKLLVPAGAGGPKFLTFKNFDVIKRYNNSTSYAMAIAGLAETLKGNTPVTAAWPSGDRQLSRDDKTRLQERLTALGFDTGGVDGQVGPATRSAIRAWQQANGVVADGYVEQELFRRIMGG